LRRLTAREMDVLRLVAAGHTNSQIASGLAITVKTVECYVTKIMKKLGFTTRLDIIRWVKHAKALGTLQDGSGPAFEFSVFPDRQ
jgi:two-component system response regulator NreC